MTRLLQPIGSRLRLLRYVDRVRKNHSVSQHAGKDLSALGLLDWCQTLAKL